MSKNNNVKPDHFKTAGREPQGQGVAHDVLHQEYEELKAKEKRDDLRMAPKEARKGRAGAAASDKKVKH